ncbi:MAG: hypothetical protein E2P02_08225 [Acidobacteria bacterium]|nr:MAG: hypothetical protein E2P02_08225 [Acidobacteriota bacterium]
MVSVIEEAPATWRRRIGAALIVTALAVASLDLFTVLINDEWSLLGALFGEGIGVRLLLITGLGLLIYWRRGVRDTHTLFLFILLVPTIYQFHGTERHMVADGFYYFSYVQSFWKDYDLHFENDYQKLGILNRPSLDQLTETGHRRNIFSVGPAIFWTPFFLLGELCGRLALWSGVDAQLEGSGPFHWNAVAVGSLLYGFLAVLLIQSLLRRYFSTSVAFAGTLLTWLATQLHWYMVYQPWMAHALGTFTVALFIWFWDRSRLRRGFKDALVLGLIGGLMASVRWQNGLILFLPFLDWLYCLWRREGKVLVAGVVFLGGFFLGLSPQLIAWKIIYGHLFYLHPPHGTAYVVYSRPFPLELLFSSRHGLLTWTPILWLGFLGLVPLLKKRLTAIWMMTFCLVLITYLNMSVSDWWAGNSFSNRRFDGALPILAFGIASSYGILSRFVSRRPAIAAYGLLAFFPVWTLLFMEQYHRHRIPIDDVVSFSDVVGNSAEILFDTIGYPFAWPANLRFARAHDASPAKFDTVVGRYFFHLHRIPRELFEIGEDDGALIDDGFSRPQHRAGRWVRVQRRRKARLFIPLARDETVRVTLHLSVRPRPVVLAVKVNGQDAGRFLVSPGFNNYVLPAPAQLHAGTNVLTFEPEFEEHGQILLWDRVAFDLIDP